MSLPALPPAPTGRNPLLPEHAESREGAAEPGDGAPREAQGASDGHGGSKAKPEADDALDFELPAAPKVGRGKLVGLAVVLVVVLGAAFAVAYLPRRHQTNALAEATQQAAEGKPRLEVVVPRLAASDRDLSLPGSVQSLEETTLYPQANGYVKKWNVDLGDKVVKGQVLVEIDTPELDQQIQQASAQLAEAKAQVEQAKANSSLAKVNLERYEKLTPEGVVSVADLDQKKAEANVSASSVTVAQATQAATGANLGRFTQQKTFSKVIAPFDGRVTQRWVERGALVSMGNANPLYRVAAVDPARVFIQIPQDVAPSIKNGIAAKVSVREFPNRTFDGVISRSAGELDQMSRTMLTEIRVPNPKSELLPGMYAVVALTLPVPHRVLEVPASAVITDSHGVRVAVVGADDTLKLITVAIERDDGATIQISSGLLPEQRVVKNGSSQLVDGLSVDPKLVPMAGGPAAAPSGGSPPAPPSPSASMGPQQKPLSQ